MKTTETNVDVTVHVTVSIGPWRGDEDSTNTIRERAAREGLDAVRSALSNYRTIATTKLVATRVILTEVIK